MPVSALLRSTAGVVALGVVALAAGCTTTATTAQNARVSTYGASYADASRYTGPDRLFRNGYVEDTYPDSSHAGSISEQRMLAAYEGIEGARLAHRLYSAAQAERLDGACEQFVKIKRRETIYDIAQYCDVPLPMLVSHNPGVRNLQHVRAGQVIEVPQIFNAERHALSAAPGEAGIFAASHYVVQPGDTLSAIAAKHLVSASDVANLNPGVSWDYLPVGAPVLIPAAGGPAGYAYEPPVVAPVSGALPYAYGPLSAYRPSYNASYEASVTALMPYVMTPAQKAAERRSERSRLLTVDRVSAGPYESVTVSGERLPANSNVSLYRGPNGNQLEYYSTVRTDSDGNFSEDVPVRSRSNAGGIIFRAQVEETGEQLDSPRVGVDRIKTDEE